jgi:hypothetical protein
MPSTYTGSGIELIAPGEQAGTWNVTTNINLQIIDRMLSQAGVISLSGTTHTLTVSDGILSDGQFGVLVFAGAPSGTNTVTVNPNTAKRTFFVRNTTAQSVILAQGSGSTVTIPPSTTKIVYTDGDGVGAAVVDVTSTLAANVVGSLTGNVTGNVTGNSATATALQTARTIGGVSFNGTANINLPGVNQAGNQNTSGNAATATALATPRTINGTSFDGTADITLSTVNTSGDQTVGGVKTFSTAIAVTGTSKADGQFYAGTTDPTNTTRLNYDGALHATSFTGDGSGLTGIATGGMTLLGTLDTTSGSTHTLSGLDLTSYKFVVAVFDQVGDGNTSSRTVSLEGAEVAITGTDNGFRTSGAAYIDLSSGVGHATTGFAQGFLPRTSSNPRVTAFRVATSNASTSLTVTISAGSFVAGSVRFYGVQ